MDSPATTSARTGCPGKKSWLGPGAITTGLSAGEVKSLARKDFSAVPHAIGFNNHMGSAVTADPGIIRTLLQVFVVLDSRTTNKSTILSVAEELGLTCVLNNVFLDDVKNIDHVRKQLLKLSREALAIKEMIPQMEERALSLFFFPRWHINQSF